ncbi:electron transport complex subunit RsxC [bacterium]|nr:electron transport complex subunit RsxC [bacterium]
MKKTFRGGTHPPEFKLTAEKAGEKLPLPSTVHIPVLQHIGAPGKAIVKKGDEVKVGQPLTQAGGFVSAPTHASISGKVAAIGEYPHPSGREVITISIDGDGNDEWFEEIVEDVDWEKVDAAEIIKRVQAAGLAGMGGAAFPTHVKLSPPKEKPIDTVIINGAECEPYLTSDHRLMLERSEEIIQGAKLIAKAVGAKRIFIGIEDNKPDAHGVLEKAANEVGSDIDLSVEMLPVKYPQGAEKQLIYAFTQREVPPPPGLPMDVGCLVQNVGSCVAIYEAVRYRKPLIERYVTITGAGVREPKNVIARIGVPVSELIETAGGYNDNAAKLLMGGPMMGAAQWTDLIPTIKGTSGVLILSEEEARIGVEMPCIVCGRCVDVCPVFLMPTTIARMSELEHYEDAEKMGALECIECGSCTFICPSKRNLVHHIRFGKTTIMAERRKAQVAKRAAG